MPVHQWGSRPLDFEFLRSRDWWADVAVTGDDGDCWEWRKSTASHGYGNTWDGVTVRLAHRVAWALHNDTQIPRGMTVDHICRNRICCNPSHLRLLTNLENASDNGFKGRTHCPAGHEYDEANTYRTPGKNDRRCRACATTHKRNRRVAA
jgi:hypothetical protein